MPNWEKVSWSFRQNLEKMLFQQQVFPQLEVEKSKTVYYSSSTCSPALNRHGENIFSTRLGCFYVTAILSWGYGWGWFEVDIEAEVDLNLRLKWSWYEIELKFNWTWVEVELSWSWDKLTLNFGRNWVFLGVGLCFKICFKSTYVAEQHMFSMLLLTSSN